jgi:hypothetical protein
MDWIIGWIGIDDLAVATFQPTVKAHHHHGTRVALLRQPLPSTDRDGARNLTLIALEHVLRLKFTVDCVGTCFETEIDLS